MASHIGGAVQPCHYTGLLQNRVPWGRSMASARGVMQAWRRQAPPLLYSERDERQTEYSSGGACLRHACIPRLLDADRTASQWEKYSSGGACLPQACIPRLLDA